jgi:hypothetical protein
MHFLKLYYCLSNWFAHNFFRVHFLQLFQWIWNQCEILHFWYLLWFFSKIIEDDLANWTKLPMKRSRQIKTTTFKNVKFFDFTKLFNYCQQSVWTPISLSKGLGTPNFKIVSPLPAVSANTWLCSCSSLPHKRTCTESTNIQHELCLNIKLTYWLC